MCNEFESFVRLLPKFAGVRMIQVEVATKLEK